MKVFSPQLVAVALALSLVQCGACGGELPLVQDTALPARTMPAPTIVVASPSALAVGDTLTVLGANFILPEAGRVLLRLRGVYFDSEEGRQQVDLTLKTHVTAAGRLEWRMWPTIPFHPKGDRLGQFVGELYVANQSFSGATQVSAPYRLSLTIKPSLIPRLLQPTEGGCAPVVAKTTEGQAMRLSVEAIGLRPASPNAPLTFYWVFLAGPWTVSTDNGIFGGQTQAAADKTAVVIEDRVESGTTSTIAGDANQNVVVKIGEDLLGNRRLKELKTGTVPALTSSGSLLATVNVTVVDATNARVTLAIVLKIKRPVELYYDGQLHLVERFTPTLVSGCMPGGALGNHVEYRESTQETHTRELSFNWNVEAGLHLNFLGWTRADWNQSLAAECKAGFGVGAGSTVSSSTEKGLTIAGQILPGMFGAFYRQTSKLERVGNVTIHTRCGDSIAAGEARLTDWRFTPDLATGPVCTPPSKLPPAEKFQ